MSRLLVFAWSIGFAFSLNSYAQPLTAHVHGNALLQVAVDGQILTINFSSPLDNLLGFEHKPRNQAQVKQVKQMIKHFYQSDLFIPSKAAQCELQTVDLDSLVIKKKHTEAHADAHETHAHEEGHADLDAVLTYQCHHAADLQDLRVNVFDAFPNLHQLNVEVVSDRGQSASQLTPDNNLATW